MEQNEIKTGHPVLGVVLAIIGICAVIPAALFFGVIGGGVCALLGLIAIILGINAKRGGRKGVPAVVLGVIAILLAVVFTLVFVSAFNTIHEKAVEDGNTPLWEKYSDDPYFGLVGIFSKIPANDEATLDQLMKEFDYLNSLTGEQVPANAD